MADLNLFPVVDITEFPEEDRGTEKYMPSVYFDFEKGDFRRDGANRMMVAGAREAYIQWCLKVTATERESFLAYDGDIGVEFEGLPGISDYESRESEIEATVTDSLMVHPATESVYNFEFQHSADECRVTFTVKGYDWDEEVLSITVPERG